MQILFKLLSSMHELKEHRFDKFSRFDNSKYWKRYYLKKLRGADTKREKKYARLIRNYVGEGARVAELASGIGFLAKELDQVGLKVTAVDLFDEMILQAKKYLLGTKVKIIKADIANTKFKDGSFDAVTAMSIIEHVSKDEVVENIIPELKRILRDRGYLFIHVPVKSSYSLFVKLLRKHIFRDLPEWAIDDDGDITHRFWISYKEYIQLFEKQGFELINYDFYLTRSHLKPKFLSSIAKQVQDLLEFTDSIFIKNIKNEPISIKAAKKIKSHLALTSYFLLRKK